MNENSSPNRASSRPSKRQRTDADLRRQRKREADRMAQKNSRERRRSHIDHLENMISILRKENGSTATCELMETVLQLRTENERLRRIINNAKTTLSLASCEATPSLPNCMGDKSPQGGRDEGPPNEDSQTSVPDIQSTKDAMLHARPGMSNGLAHDMEQDRGILQFLGLPGNSRADGTLHFTDSWMDKMAAMSGTRPRPDLNTWAWLSPLSTMMPSVPRPSGSAAQCPIWERSNKIYSQISKVNPKDTCAALSLSSADYADLIFKAVINGWDALDSQERNNPIMRTLGDMDQVFSQLDRVSRAAFMYKSHMLLKYHLDPKNNWEEMPEWQRPLHSQRTRQHPIAVDFFVWPPLRDRLVENNHSYFATSDFSAYFRRYYKFNWPFPFEDAYVYDKESNTYRTSPIFERYHRNIRYWGMGKPFLDRFPELVHDVTLSNSDNSPSGDSLTLGNAFAEPFTDREITDLFNDYPQVA